MRGATTTNCSAVNADSRARKRGTEAIWYLAATGGVVNDQASTPVRDLMFKGRHRYKDFLEAEEGIASNVLADRLRRLEAAGIIWRAADPEDGRRAVYSLTKKGIELAPVLVDLVIWSAKHHDTGAPGAIVRLMRDQRDAFLQGVLHDWTSQQKGRGVPGKRRS